MTLPALRDRREDIPILAGHFLQRFSLKYNRQGLELTPEQQTLLSHYDWPGNIRELQNVIERAVLLSTDGRLHLDFPATSTASVKHPFDDLPDLDELQRRYIAYIMDKTNGKMSGPGGAAELLGMKRTSLYNRMKKLGMR
jgi:DNA-binding NtrC family response regulator